MRYYSQTVAPTFFNLDDPLELLSKDNRWVILGDRLPWDKIEVEYNKRLDNRYRGAGNKPARMIIGAVIIKHLCNFSDRMTITMIRENPYMQYFVGLPRFINEPIFDASLFVAIRKRLDSDFFNLITHEVVKAEGKSKIEDDDSHSENNGGENTSSTVEQEACPQNLSANRGILKTDATCCDAEMRYPTDYNLLEDGSEFVHRLLEKYCKDKRIDVPANHRSVSRCAFLSLIKQKHKGKKLRDSVKRTQIRSLEADIQILFHTISSDFSEKITKTEATILQATFRMLRQQKQMLHDNVHRCEDRIVSIYQSHVRPIVRGKAKAKTEFGAKVGAAIVDGYTYLDHISWDAYNESEDLAIHLERYRERFGCYPEEVQADKIYLTKENRKLLKEHRIACYCPALGRPPKHVDEEVRRLRHKASCERNEIEATFGTGKRVYRANDIRAKLPNTAVSWIGACFFAKNIKKFLRELFVSILEIRDFLARLRGFLRGVSLRDTCTTVVPIGESG